MKIDITLIIATRDRYGHLLRLLSFIEKYKYIFSIIILDSSENKIQNTEILYFKNKENIIWKNIDPRKNKWQKISENVNLIKTEFCTLCADDDFINPKALIKCKSYLKKNLDFSCAQGFYYNHVSYNDYIKNKFQRWSFIYYNADKEGNVEDDEFKRVEKYLSGNKKNGGVYPPYYALHRVDNFKIVWHEAGLYVEDWNLEELFPACISFLLGKMKILPILYATKEPNSYFVNRGDVIERSYSSNKIEKAINGIMNNLVNYKSEDESYLIKKKILKDLFYKQKKRQTQLVKTKEQNQKNNFIRRYPIKSKVKDFVYYLFFNGCPLKIYFNSFRDYQNICESVISAKLSEEDLNIARKTYENRGRS